MVDVEVHGMTTATINVKLDADTANIFADAPDEDKSRLCMLWAVLLREYKEAPMPLRKLMDQIGKKAKQRGLTPEKLDSILNAD